MADPTWENTTPTWENTVSASVPTWDDTVPTWDETISTEESPSTKLSFIDKLKLVKDMIPIYAKQFFKSTDTNKLNIESLKEIPKEPMFQDTVEYMNTPLYGATDISKRIGQGILDISGQGTQLSDIKKKYPIPYGITKGIVKTAEGFTTPSNVALLFGTGSLGNVGSKLASLLFGYGMGKGAIDKMSEYNNALIEGDKAKAAELGTSLVAEGIFSASAFKHSLLNGKPLDVNTRKMTEEEAIAFKDIETKRPTPTEIEMGKPQTVQGASQVGELPIVQTVPKFEETKPIIETVKEIQTAPDLPNIKELETMKTEIGSADVQRWVSRKGKPFTDSNLPQYYKNAGIESREDIFNIFEKYESGKKLTEKQEGILKELTSEYRQYAQGKERTRQYEELNKVEPVMIDDLALKEGDKVDFVHGGEKHSGVVESVKEDGSVKIVNEVTLNKKPTDDLKVIDVNPTPKETPSGQMIISDMPSAQMPSKPIEVKANQVESRNLLEGFKPEVEQPGLFENRPPAIPPMAPPVAEMKPSQGGRETQRGFLETVEKSPQSAQETVKTVENIKPQTYEQVTNKESLNEANKIIAESEDTAKIKLFDEKLTEENAGTKGAIAIQLSKKYENEGRWDDLSNLVDKADTLFRAGGRLVQAASLWNRLSPAGFLKLANRVAEKHKVELDGEFKKTIAKRMSEIQKIADETEKANQTILLMKDVAKRIPISFGEAFEAYRYQNMLSSPGTSERNIYQGLFNGLLTRPFTLGAMAITDFAQNPYNPVAREVKFMDAPRYIKDTLAAIPEAFIAAKEGFKSGFSDKFEVGGKDSANIIENLRFKNMPLKYSFVTRLMEAQDKFIASLISSGEKARLMRNGMKEGQAKTQAVELAKKYLYREKQDFKNKDNSYSVRALDELGNLALKGRKLPIFGKPYSWFVPFIKVPINASKFMVENTPVNLLGGKQTKEKDAMALVGSMMMAYGAVKAYNDEVAWAAPKDEKGKTLFYSSGRKPFSFKVGDKWVPLFYAGPYALSLAIPAAVKHYYEDSGRAMADDEIEKMGSAITDITKFLMSQTSLKGVSSFYKVIDGEDDATPSKMIGYTAGQVIPLQGLVKFANSIADPVFRKSKGFTEAIQKDLPILSKQLMPYMNLEYDEKKGYVPVPAKKSFSDLFMPYGIGTDKGGKIEKNYKDLLKKSQVSGLKSDIKYEALKDLFSKKYANK